MIFFSGELIYKLLHCRHVGAAFLISMDIVIFLRCWLWWPAASNYYCQSWTMNTWVVTYADDYTGQWFDDDMMIPTTTADHGLRLPSSSTMSMISGRRRRDVSSSMLLMMLSSFAVPPGGVPVAEVMIYCVCAPVQLCADEHLLRRWWVSRLHPLKPSELDKQFVSDRWTLEDDDDPASSLPALTWLNFVFYYYEYCVIVSEHPVCLSVCHPTRCRVADVSISSCIYSHIYLVFTPHLSLYLVTNQRALEHLQLLLESLINSNPCPIRLPWADIARYSVC